MDSKQRKARGLLSTLGLALLAMLALGSIVAGAAQASPVWHVNGNEFLSKESIVSSGGSLKLAVPAWKVHFKCSTTSTIGSISGGNGGEAVLSASKCLYGTDAGYYYPQSQCDVKPLQFNVVIGLGEGEAGEVIEAFTPQGEFDMLEVETGSWCPWPFTGDEFPLVNLDGSIGATVGAKEAVVLPLSNSAGLAVELWHPGETMYMYLEGSSSQYLTGALKGQKLGAW